MAVPDNTVASYLTLKMMINGVKNGWSESYNLIAASFGQAEAAATLLCNARTRLLAKNHLLWDGVISTAHGPADGYQLEPLTRLPKPVDSETTPGLTQDDAVGINVVFDTGRGKTATHLVRGIRSIWVASSALTVTPTAAVAQNFAVAAPYITYSTTSPWNTSADTIMNFLCLVRDLTCMYVPSVGTPGQWDQYKFDVSKGGGYTIDPHRQTSKRAVGNKFPRTKGREPNYT